jgi:PAS domain S-box-containing protein
MPIKELEAYKQFVAAQLGNLNPLLQNYAIGDFSENIPVPEEENEFTELFVGLSLMVDDFRGMIKESEQTIAKLKKTEKELLNHKQHLEELIAERTATVQKSESLLNATGKMAKVGGWELNVENDELYWTEEVYHIHELDLNYKPNVADAIDFYTPESRPIISDAIQNAIKTGTPFDHELQIKTAKGNTRWIQALGQAGKGNGKIGNIWGTFQDITDWKLSQKQLQFLATISDSSPISVISVDKCGKIAYVNPATEKMYGYSRDELRGKDPSILNADPNDENIQKEIFKTIGRGDVWKGEIFNKRKNGELFYIHASVYQLIDENGNFLAAVGFQEDITEQKNAEEQIAIFHRFAETSQQGFGMATLDGKIYYTNPTLLKLLGEKKLENIKGKSFFSYLPKEVQLKMQQVVIPTVKKKGHWSGELSLLSKDGKVIPTFESFSLIRNDKGDPLYLTDAITDITKRKKAEEDARINVIKFRALFESMRSGVAVYEPIDKGKDFVFRDFNKAAEKIDKINRKDVLNKRLRAAFPGVEAGGLLDVFQRVWKTGKAENFPVSLYHDHRISGWRENYVYKLPTGEVVSIYDDVTKEKQAEEELKKHHDKLEVLVAERTEKLETINLQLLKEINERKITEKNLIVEKSFSDSVINSLPGIFYMFDKRGKYVRWNKNYEDVSEYSAEDMTKASPLDFFTGETKKKIASKILEVFTKGQTSVEGEFISKSGYRTPFFFTGRRLKIGGKWYLVGMGIDITEQKEAEKAMKESEERYRTFVQNFHGIAFRSHMNWSPIFFHGDVEQITGYKEEDFINGNPGWDQVIQKDDLKALMENYPPEKFSDPNYVAEREYRIIHKNGKVRWVHDSLQSLKDNSGKPAFLQGALYDVTDRKQAEEKLQITLQDLERSNKELEQFAYVASHDLQEPLRMVSSYTQLLARRYQEKLDDDANEFIHYAVDGAKRMQVLINDLLAFSRVGTRGKPFESTDCNNVLKQTLLNLGPSINETRAAITTEKLPCVSADEGQLIQLFQNLIGNAIKFHNDELPQIHVNAESKDNDWIFSVKDNGIGISEEYKDRIFVIFKRLHNRNKYSGTGIGLAICKKIVDRHGGEIWVESESGKGSTFYFTIKRKER